MTLRRVAFAALCVVSVTPVWLGADEPAEDLLQTVANLDELAFGAFNDRDLDRFVEFFAEDLEFYHDQDGLSGYAQLVESSERLFGQTSPLRRRLIPGSLEVHPVPGYGAIQIGKHEFCHEENGIDDCGVFGFTHVWNRTSDGWKITRVLSYGP
jgi:hypothetical protein